MANNRVCCQTHILDEVHSAIDNNLVVEVKFQWVKYITDWTRSGPD